MTDNPHDKPRIRTLIEILDRAGPEGILAAEIADQFTCNTRPVVLSSINATLSRAKHDGRARRGPFRETPPGRDRRARSYRWWITAAGKEYLNPVPIPEIIPMNEPPSPKRILEILKEAGDEGMRGSDIARHFTIAVPSMPSMQHLNKESQSLQRKMAWTNQVLDRFWAKDFVIKGAKEPSPYYHNVPVFRWFITDAGVEHLAAGLSEGIRAARRAEDEAYHAQLAVYQKRLADLLTDAYAKTDPEVTPQCERERVMKELREAGCTLQDIGDVFGLTRERARQIIVGKNVNPCQCPLHLTGNGLGWPE